MMERIRCDLQRNPDTGGIMTKMQVSCQRSHKSWCRSNSQQSENLSECQHYTLHIQNPPSSPIHTYIFNMTWHIKSFHQANTSKSCRSWILSLGKFCETFSPLSFASHFNQHLISPHLISYNLMISHLISSHTISSHLISYDFISYNFKRFHLISLHIKRFHLISCHSFDCHLSGFVTPDEGRSGQLLSFAAGEPSRACCITKSKPFLSCSGLVLDYNPRSPLPSCVPLCWNARPRHWFAMGEGALTSVWHL